MVFMTMPIMVQYMFFFYGFMIERGYPYLRRKAGLVVLYSRFIYGVTKLIITAYWRKYFPPKENVKVISRSKIEVSYKFRDTEYRFRTSIKRGALEDVHFLDENGDDVTSALSPYVGPGQDFHAIKYTPSDFGYKSIKVIKEDSEPVTFTEHEDIYIN